MVHQHTDHNDIKYKKYTPYFVRRILCLYLIFTALFLSGLSINTYSTYGCSLYGDGIMYGNNCDIPISELDYQVEQISCSNESAASDVAIIQKKIDCTGSLKPGYVSSGTDTLKIGLYEGFLVTCSFINDTDFECKNINIGSVEGDFNLKIQVGDGPLEDVSIAGEEKIIKIRPLISFFFDNTTLMPIGNEDFLSLYEDGEEVQYYARLNRRPLQEVSFIINNNPQVEISSEHGDTVIFSPEDWDIPKVITVKAVEDGVDEGLHSSSIEYSNTVSGEYFFEDIVLDYTNLEIYEAKTPRIVFNTIKNNLVRVPEGEKNNDEAGIFIENFPFDTDELILKIKVSNNEIILQNELLRFNKFNYRDLQYIGIQSIDDNFDRDDSSIITASLIDEQQNNKIIVEQEVRVEVLDDDEAGIEISQNQSMISLEEGESGVVSVRLKSQPTSNDFVTVGINVVYSDKKSFSIRAGEQNNSAIQNHQLFFNKDNWNIYQNIDINSFIDNDLVDNDGEIVLYINDDENTSPEYQYLKEELKISIKIQDSGILKTIVTGSKDQVRYLYLIILIIVLIVSGYFLLKKKYRRNSQ